MSGAGSMIHTYFKTYEVEEPGTHAVTILGGGAYLAAALLGSLYVLLKGFVGRFFLALAVDAAAALATFLIAVPVTAHLGGADAVIALIIIIMAACIGRSVPIITIVKNGYRSRGWLITRI
jgi:hypothetical protein